MNNGRRDLDSFCTFVKSFTKCPESEKQIKRGEMEGEELNSHETSVTNFQKMLNL